MSTISRRRIGHRHDEQTCLTACSSLLFEQYVYLCSDLQKSDSMSSAPHYGEQVNNLKHYGEALYSAKYNSKLVDLKTLDPEAKLDLAGEM